jgi:hypothetical protein
MMLLLCTLACRSDAPVLTGIAVESSEDEDALHYQKPEGVYVDLAYLGGARWDRVRGEVTEQLGDILEVNDLGVLDGTEYVLERGRVKVKAGEIYLVHVDLPRPTRPGSALATCNLPTTADNPFRLTHEIRYRWHAGFDRIRLGREERDEDMVIWVEALKFDPRDR